MADIFDRPTRSRIMSAIRGRNTKPELIVRRFLHSRGLRFRAHVADLPGKPDIVLRRLNTVNFIGLSFRENSASAHPWVIGFQLEEFADLGVGSSMTGQISIEDKYRRDG
jgi:DNA mismatch endonuclease Vsr